jgi:hypothetical protein
MEVGVIAAADLGIEYAVEPALGHIGFPVGYAVSGILFTVFGYFAMILAQ